MHDFAHSVIEITRLDFAYYSHPTACIDQVRGEILKKKCHVIILLLAPNRHEIATLFASLVFTLCLEETPASDLTFWDLVRYLSSPRLSETVCCYTGRNFNMSILAKLMARQCRTLHVILNDQYFWNTLFSILESKPGIRPPFFEAEIAWRPKMIHLEYSSDSWCMACTLGASISFSHSQITQRSEKNRGATWEQVAVWRRRWSEGTDGGFGTSRSFQKYKYMTLKTEKAYSVFRFPSRKVFALVSGRSFRSKLLGGNPLKLSAIIPL